MSTDTFPRLLGDIGGTHARFAWQADATSAISDASSYRCDQHDTLLSAVRQYIAEQGKTSPRAGAIGIANPVTGDAVRMTNHHWSFSISELQHELGLQRLLVINDFTALALSLPALTPEDLRPIGGGTAVVGAARALIGPGTGLGVSGLLPATCGAGVPIHGEGGHVTLAPDNELESAVVLALKKRFGHASAERALSGPGLVNLYGALCEVDGHPAEPLDPADVIERSRAEPPDARCVAAVHLFCALLGSTAGNLALTLGARGGVYIGGGIAPRILKELERSAFRQRFESKGRFRDYLAEIPTCVIDSAVSPAFLGAARALDQAGSAERDA
jgi:glucokinase